MGCSLTSQIANMTDFQLNSHPGHDRRRAGKRYVVLVESLIMLPELLHHFIFRYSTCIFYLMRSGLSPQKGGADNCQHCFCLGQYWRCAAASPWSRCGRGGWCSHSWQWRRDSHLRSHKRNVQQCTLHVFTQFHFPICHIVTLGAHVHSWTCGSFTRW